MRVLFEDCRDMTTIEPLVRYLNGEQNIILRIDSGNSSDLDRVKTITLSTNEALALAVEINALVVDIEMEAHNSLPWWKRMFG